MSIAAFPSVLVALGLQAIASPVIEWSLTIAALSVAALAVRAGYRRHRVVGVTLVFAVGAAGLIGSRLLETTGMHTWGTAMSVGAGLSLITAHLLNLRFVKRAAVGQQL